MIPQVYPSDFDPFPIIRTLPHLTDHEPPVGQLKLWEDVKTGLSCHYAPFEYLNTEARIILVGITPGGTQMNRALNAARLALTTDHPIADAVRAVKRESSFSGAMRPNIVNTLNRLGYQKKLGIDCASRLWSTHDHLVHFCSLLKFPVFLNGKDYNGNPKPHKNPILQATLIEHFARDMAALPPDSMLVPLGDTVLEALLWLKGKNLVPQSILSFEGRFVAPPHPSGANAESISLLMETVYPGQEEYAEKMYAEYLKNEPWKKKKGQPQPEHRYKAIRKSRWVSMQFVRRAYGLD